ncbi:MAG: Ig-like domain-containing protein [Bacteroidales bacterium]|nr:Ig-like domain-containing protein [Bacteroidales bacterium]
MKKIILYLIAISSTILLSLVSLTAQTTCTITGHVKDGPDGAPLPSVTILIEGTGLGGTTNIYGEYNIINVPAGIVTVGVLRPGYSDISKTIVAEPGVTYTVNFWSNAVEDIDGNSYSAVEIGNQIWMGENLKVTHYTDGSAIPYITGDAEWEGSADIPAFCWPSNDSANKDIYGAFYNWNAVNWYTVSTGRLCPDGWHVPTDEEWTSLALFLDPTNATSGGMLKETGTTHWSSPNTGATNESGFTALPGGHRNNYGQFTGTGISGYWWTSTLHSPGYAYMRGMYYNISAVASAGIWPVYGMSVRCIKDVAEPIVTTAQVSSITATTAQSGGYISPTLGIEYSDGRGVCWSTSPNPTIDNGNTEWTEDLSGTGSFISLLTGLQPGTTYYVRAYGMNRDAPTYVYGNEISFTTLQEPDVVTTTADYNPIIGEPVFGSLRSALEYANNNPGTTISFNIPGDGPHTIRPLLPLPQLIVSTTIDGFTQPGASSETSTLLVELDGVNAGNGSNGITIASDNCTVRGLVINRFSGSGIYLDHANGNIIEGNFIGTDKTGSNGIGNGSWDELNNLGHGAGISLFLSNNNRIGGSSLTERNLISANPHAGIWIRGYYDIETGTFHKSSGNLIKGNLIGTDIGGTKSLANRYGIAIDTSVNNQIGGLTPGERNIISGNLNGIKITGGDESKGNSITGNYVGTNISGTNALGNNWGILLFASETMIGGSAPGAGNIISGSPNQGLSISGGLAHQGPSSGNIIKGNYIGVDAAGHYAIPNGFGIMIMNSGDNQIGGNMATEGNLISGNTEVGLYVGYMNATNNKIEGNRIGVTADGKTALGNGIGQEDIFGYGGININGPGNTIGGVDPQKRNIISGNLTGITLRDSADNCIVLGNYIGTDITGSNAIPNINNGIAIKGGKDNTIGGSAPNSGNIISGNLKNGIILTLSDVFPTVGNEPENPTGNLIQGNFIGTDIQGKNPVPNAHGITVNSGRNTTIAKNQISGNTFNGINICNDFNAASVNNLISQNSIYNNGQIGIDLDLDGVTYNDVDSIPNEANGGWDHDTDAGANNHQNFPVIDSIMFDLGSKTIYVKGYLKSNAYTQYTLEFFASKVPDNMGYGEGQTFLGSKIVTTDGYGKAPFSETFTLYSSWGDVITATATDPDGNTSEFSEAVGGLKEQILAGINQPFYYKVNKDGVPNILDGSDITAVNNAFKTWTDVAVADIDFINSGTTTDRYASATDGVNLVSFMDDRFPFPPGVLAIAAKTLKVNPSSEYVEIIDADIVFNPAYVNHPEYNLGTGTNGYFDIQSVTTHEIGHVIGLIHSGVVSSTMFFTLGQGTAVRDLETDDIAWTGYRYPKEPDYSSGYGTISGNITYGYNGDAVAGALVYAINTATKDSVHAYSDAWGNYIVPVPAPANYNIYIEPLDGGVNGYNLKPCNISVYVYCNTIYTDYPGEFCSPGESSTESSDDPVDILVSPGSESSGNNIITDLDITPPSVISVLPEALTDPLPDLIPEALLIDATQIFKITFSEPVDEKTLTDETCFLTTGEGEETGTITGDFKKMSEYPDIVLFTPKEALKYETDYVLKLTVDITDMKNNNLDKEYSYNYKTTSGDTDPPSIKYIIPANGTKDVFVTADIKVFFSEPMNKESVENGLELSFTEEDAAGGGTVKTKTEGSFTWKDSNTELIYTPLKSLREGTEYTIALSGSIADLEGNAIGEPGKSYKFTTVPEANPEIIYLGPADLKSGVTVETPVVVDFSEPINPNTVNSETFMLMLGANQVAGSFDFLNDNSRVVFRPETNLLFSQTYTITLTDVIEDVSEPALNLEKDTSTTFTTAADLKTPHIDYLEPISGVVGSLVTVSGSGFDPEPGNNTVIFNGVKALVVKSSLTSLVTKVPVGAVSGPVSALVNGTATDNSMYFYMIPQSLDPCDDVIANVPIGTKSRDIDITADAATAYVTNPDAGTVTVVDMQTFKVTETIPVGKEPFKIDINPAGTKAYVTNYASHDVSVIDLSKNSVINTISVGINPYGVVVTPDGKRVYVANYSAEYLSLIDIDPESGGFDHVVANVSTGTKNTDITVTADAGYVLVAGDDGLKIVSSDPADLKYNSVVANVSTGTKTTAIDVLADAGIALVATEDGNILIIDIYPGNDTFGAVIANVSTGSKIGDIVVSGDAMFVYLTDPDNNVVSVYKLTNGGTATENSSQFSDMTLTLHTTIDVGDSPAGLVIDAQNQQLVVVNSGEEEIDNLTVIRICCGPISPVTSIGDLIIKVQTMINFGIIKPAIGYDLIKYLNNALYYLSIDKTKSAINSLNTFVVKVKDLIKSRQITYDQGQPLVDAAETIIAQLKGTKSDDQKFSLSGNEEWENDVISESGLGNIYPNPSKNAITIDYEISAAGPDHGKTSVNVYDLSGRLVRILVNSTLEPGRYSASWDGNSENGTPVPRGIYFIRLESGNTDQVRQILLVR